MVKLKTTKHRSRAKVGDTEKPPASHNQIGFAVGLIYKPWLSVDSQEERRCIGKSFESKPVAEMLGRT
jgi:hypothetical protein